MPRARPDAVDVIRWTAATCENLAAPDKALALLRRATETAPSNPAPRLKLANLYLDRFDFAAAAAQFEIARDLDPAATGTSILLARCYTVLRRPADAMAALAHAEGTEAHYQRGVALSALDRAADAEAEFRAALAAEPRHRRACMTLCGLLRKAGRTAELLALCEGLAARGIDHAQLLLDWGRALALTGSAARARHLLFDPARLTRHRLPVPPGFADLAAFNAALAAELLANPFPLSDFPGGEEANRGSSRVHSLLAGRNPQLIRTLIETLQGVISARAAATVPLSGFDPWAGARPASAHLHPWGLLQRGGEHEAWHTHRGGWLSGVYYIRVPPEVSPEGEGRGCIEFGPPPALREALPDLVPTQRIAPREGLLLLAPSHYHHRTIPTGAGTPRISFAFDVVPDALPFVPYRAS